MATTPTVLALAHLIVSWQRHSNTFRIIVVQLGLRLAMLLLLLLLLLCGLILFGLAFVLIIVIGQKFPLWIWYLPTSKDAIIIKQKRLINVQIQVADRSYS